MFWAFLEIAGELSYCPLADFGACNVREGHDLFAKAVVAQPITGNVPLTNSAQVSGQIVLMERGICDFVTKVMHAQNAGALAVLIANQPHEDPHAAFVMDAGRRRDEASAIRIPAMMISHAKSSVLFDQLRESYLDRRDFFLSIKFLGAESASAILEQIEVTKKQQERQAQERKQKQQREQQQRQISKHLRSRIHVSQSDTASIRSGSRSTRAPSESSRASSRRTPRSARRQSTTTTPLHESRVESNDTSSLSSHSESNQSTNDDNQPHTTTSYCSSLSMGTSSRSNMMNHWCPMTTALLIMDVQNYFALHQNEQCLETHASVNLDYYKRINSVMVPNIQDVLLACRACEGVEIVYGVVESSTRDGRDRSRAHKHAGLHVPKGGFGAKILHQISPSENDIVIARTGVNIFESTNIDYVLRNLGVSHLVIMGISCLQSIEACLQSALDKGYQVSIIKDAITIENQPQNIDEAACKFEHLGAQVVHSAAFVQEIHSFSVQPR